MCIGILNYINIFNEKSKKDIKKKPNGRNYETNWVYYFINEIINICYIKQAVCFNNRVFSRVIDLSKKYLNAKKIRNILKCSFALMKICILSTQQSMGHTTCTSLPRKKDTVYSFEKQIFKNNS